MTRYSLALLSLLASTAYAVPHYNQHGHKHPVHHKSGPQPSGVVSSGSGFVPTGGPTAPYGLANSTVAGPTDTAPVTSKPISTSVVTVVPEPEPTTAQESSIESSVNNFPVGGSSAAEECGPATVTVTKADTITVTVSANSVESPNETTSAADGESTSAIISESSSSDVHESPSVTQPGPLESSSSAASPENASTSSAEAGESYEAPETPETAESSTEESIEEEPAKEEPTAEESAEEEPATKVPTAEEPTGEEPAKEEPTKEEAAAEESAEEPATKVPTVEEPTGEEPAKEEPTKEEPTKEEPTSGDSPPTPRTPSTDNVVARGLVYNEASLTSAFSNANVGWMYNWNSAPGGQIDSSKEFVPMLWNTSQVFHVPHWEERAEAAIAAGSKHLLAFNEPDLPAQANMDVDQSVAGWMDYMEPFHAKHNGAVKLGSPSVCNGPEKHLGLSYLSDFLASCGGCHVDFITIHWYGLANDDGVGHLKEHIGKAQEVAAGRPIWLTEFKPDGSDEQQAEFLGKILPWLDDKSNGVDRYAYFKADNMVNGASLTQAGAAYAA